MSRFSASRLDSPTNLGVSKRTLDERGANAEGALESSAERLVTVALGRFNHIVELGIAAVLAKDDALCVVASGLDVDALEALLKRGGVELAILSSVVGRIAWERLRLACPRAGIVVLGPAPALAYGAALIAARVSYMAWSMDDRGANELASVVRRAAHGDALLMSSDGRVLASRLRDQPSLLTAREIEVLARLSEDLKYAEIARLLGIAPETVRRHVASICSKLKIANRRELSAVAADVDTPGK